MKKNKEAQENEEVVKENTATEQAEENTDSARRKMKI